MAAVAAVVAAGAAAAVVVAATGGGKPSAFVSPSGNIQCAYVATREAVACRTLAEHHVALVRSDGTVERPRTLPADVAARLEGASSLLAYGRHRTFANALRCDSSETGMRCASWRFFPSRGFEICRAGVDVLATNRTRVCHV